MAKKSRLFIATTDDLSELSSLIRQTLGQVGNVDNYLKKTHGEFDEIEMSDTQKQKILYHLIDDAEDLLSELESKLREALEHTNSDSED